MPTFQAFISDLDDTLLTLEHQLTPRTEQTLKRLLKQGIKVILASGRSAASMRRTVRQVGTPYPYIAYNGAQIVDPATDEVIAGNEIGLSLAREVLEWFEARGVYLQIYFGDHWYYARESPIAREYSISTGVLGTCVGTLSAFIKNPTPKILAIDEPGRAQELLHESRAVFGDVLSITTSKPTFVEITSPEATKGNAVRHLAGMIGLDPETTLCAGDSLNDLSMLEWSHYPLTVANARQEVKEIAWRTAGDGHHDGMAILLDELIPEV